MEEEIRKASEEKESSLVGSALAHVGLGRRSSRSRENSEKQRLRAGSGPESLEEVVGPSICPSTPFYTFVSHSVVSSCGGRQSIFSNSGRVLTIYGRNGFRSSSRRLTTAR